MQLFEGVFLAILLLDDISCQYPDWSQSHQTLTGNNQTTTQTSREEENNNNNGNKRRISEMKCDEYGKYAVKVALGADVISIMAPIAGGKKADYSEFPHMALVGYKKDANVSFYCGGSLISENFVLTASHCKSREKDKTTNFARFNTIARSSAGQIDRYGTFISHPSYKIDRKNYDIALLKLSQSFNFSVDKRILPACLHSQDEQSKYIKAADATGWGFTDFGQSEPSENLQKVTLDIIDCTLKGQFNLFNAVCASSPGKDTCQGDSGGPLQIKNKRDFEGAYISQILVIGVTSGGSAACGLRNSYGVYTEVSKFLDWIEQNVWPIENERLQSIQNIRYPAATQQSIWAWVK